MRTGLIAAALVGTLSLVAQPTVAHDLKELCAYVQYVQEECGAGSASHAAYAVNRLTDKRVRATILIKDNLRGTRRQQQKVVVAPAGGWTHVGCTQPDVHDPVAEYEVISCEVITCN